MKAECSVAQKYINAFSRCGSLRNEFAINFENGCRRNSAGEYCRILEISSFPIACQSGCSAACRTILTNGGCCFSFYMDSATEYFNACVLDIPSACPSTSLSIPTSSDDASCSSRDDFSGLKLTTFAIMDSLSTIHSFRMTIVRILHDIYKMAADIVMGRIVTLKYLTQLLIHKSIMP